MSGENDRHVVGYFSDTSLEEVSKVVGGVIICDDYRFLKGVDMAIEEFLKDKHEKEIHSSNMQCIIIKQ